MNMQSHLQCHHPDLIENV